MKKLVFMSLAVILAIGLVLGSCSEPEKTTVPTTTAPTTTAPTSTAPTTIAPTTTTPTTSTPTTEPAPLGPQYGGILIRGGSYDPGIFGVPWEMNPGGHSAALPALEKMIFEDGEGNLHPYLATDWEITDDQMHIIVNLRQNVKFHDGTDWNADAAKWNLDKQIEAKIGAVSELSSVDVVSEYQIKINLNKFDNTVLVTALGAWNAQMISPTSFEENGIEWARHHPVGTGPFEFASYQRDDSLEYKKFDGYWQEGKPYLDGIRTVIIQDNVTRSMALKTGDIHETTFPASSITADLDAAGFPYVEAPRLSTIDALIFNNVDPDSPFTDKRVRQAIEYAINKEALTQATGFGSTRAAYQLAPPDSPAYIPEVQPRTYNPDKARELLEAAGLGGGFSTIIMPDPGPLARDPFVVIQQFLSDVGITAELEFVEMGTYMEAMYANGWSGILAEKTGLFPSLTKGLKFYWSGFIFPSLKYPEGFREAYNEALATTYTEPDKVKKVLEMLYEEALVIPFQEVIPRCYVADGVHEPDINFDIPPFIPCENVWMEQ
jgi:ABC-type transport system substrate-binding protein